ncbi:MAG: GAF domain-containing protein [Pseudomonadota bacterium]
MSDQNESGEELLCKKKEFVQAFFRKGIEFTEELLRENEKLRYRVVQLEEQLASTSRALPTQTTLRELIERIHVLSQERDQLLKRYEYVEAENRGYVTRFHEIERENNSLASLYVATYQIHSTIDLREVLQIIEEILLNFVGAKVFSIMLVDEDTQLVHPVAKHGGDGKIDPVPVGKGRVVGRVAASGEPHYDTAIRTGTNPNVDNPGICFALKIKDRIVGVTAIWEFLAQKTELVEVDFEIFDLLGAHAASAIEAARLAAETGEAHRFRFATFSSLL